MKYLSFVLILVFIFIQLTACQGNSPQDENWENENVINGTSTNDNREHFGINSVKIESNQDKRLDENNERNRARWIAANIADYDMVVTIFTPGFSPTPGPVLIQVRNGNAVATKLLSKPHPGSMEVYSTYNTVDKIFEEIQKQINAEGKSRVRRYDRRFGYPVETVFYCGGTCYIRIKIQRFEKAQ